MNVSVEGNQNTRIQVQRGSTRRRGGQPRLSGALCSSHSLLELTRVPHAALTGGKARTGGHVRPDVQRVGTPCESPLALPVGGAASLTMICTLLRAAQYTGKLPRSPGRRWLLPRLVRSQCDWETEPGVRRLQGQKKPVRPRWALGVAPKAICTQARSPRRAKEESGKQVSVHSQRGGTAISASQRVKEAGRDVSYLIVVLIGIGVTGGLFYTIFKELFSSSSPSKIYGKALEKCRAHPEVISVFGEPVKGYGEMTRRGRRQHVSFIEYVKDGLKHMRVKFYIEGSEPGKRGTVHLEVKENPESGDYEFRYIFVELEAYPRRTIVIEDNRT